MNQEGQLTVGILIFDNVEVLDFCGPFEVFSSASSVGELVAAQTARYMEYDWKARGN
jgi:putative intracellular protease/amidase